MQISAKELKIGMTVRNGYWTVDIDKIEEGVLKNGKTTYTVSGKGTHRNTGYRGKITKYDSIDFTFKADTKVKCGMSDKKQTGFRISGGLLKRLKAEAKKQKRSVNNLVEVLIDKHVPKIVDNVESMGSVFVN